MCTAIRRKINVYDRTVSFPLGGPHQLRRRWPDTAYASPGMRGVVADRSSRYGGPLAGTVGLGCGLGAYHQARIPVLRNRQRRTGLHRYQRTRHAGDRHPPSLARLDADPGPRAQFLGRDARRARARRLGGLLAGLLGCPQRERVGVRLAARGRYRLSDLAPAGPTDSGPKARLGSGPGPAACAQSEPVLIPANARVGAVAGTWHVRGRGSPQPR